MGRRGSEPSHYNEPQPFLSSLLTMAKSKISRKITKQLTNSSRARHKINNLRSVTQASIMAFASTIAFVIFLITKYHLSFQTILHSRAIKSVVTDEQMELLDKYLISHPIKDGEESQEEFV